MKITLKSGNVANISRSLDRLGLRESADQLVVIGGAALAVFGIKPLRETDLDIAVTSELMSQLEADGQWELSLRQATMSGVAHEREVVGYNGLTITNGDVTAIKMPLDDLYRVSSAQLIKKSITPDDSAYRFIGPARVLDWKLSLVNSPYYSGPKAKHLEDATRISSFLTKISNT